MKYIAKENTWFKEGTEVKLIDDYRNDYPPMNGGLFEGIRIVENSLAEGGRKVGEEHLDQEVCNFDEFIVEEL